MILGINAWNITGGGCLTHLYEILQVVDPNIYGFDKVILWASRKTLSKIPDRNWLIKEHVPMLDKSLPHRYLWQKTKLKKIAEDAKCNVLFVPGGSDASKFRPVVTMSRNMLPFEWKELRRYGVSLTTLKLLLIRAKHIVEYKKADGVILLNKHAYDTITGIIGSRVINSTIIPHGINKRFYSNPSAEAETNCDGRKDVYNIVYVSRVELYKHQWNVVEAVSKLRATGYPVTLTLVGPDGSGTGRLQQALQKYDPLGLFIFKHDEIPYDKLHSFYTDADINVFASSCENMPNTLLEGMASGLPIACSRCGPMPEILGDAGLYFDPESADSIAQALVQYIESPQLRTVKARNAYEKALEYSWERCADMTFKYLSTIALPRC